MSSSELAIEARGLGKCYHVYRTPKDRLKQFLNGRRRRYYTEFWAGRELDFDVPAGETLGIVGRNGAGKTTLLQMIAGTLAPTEGELVVRGRVTALLELGSGFHRDYTGRENVFLSGALLGVPRAEMEARFDTIAAFAGIGEFMERPVRTYSKGMFVRLAFAVLANTDPDVFIVDEALAVGDAQFRHRCMLRFHELREAGTTVLYVSHDAGSMKRLCDRVMWIDGGRLQDIGRADVVVDRYLAALFGQEVHQDFEDTGDEGPPRRALPALAPAAPDRTAAEDGFPNVDRRMGDRSLTLLGAGLYDVHGHPLRHVEHGERVTLRTTVAGGARPFERGRWFPGYVLRGPKGEDLASTNARTEQSPMPALAAEEELTVRTTIALPLLQPGTYTLSPTLAYSLEGERVVLADQVDNALVFTVTAARKVHSMLALETAFEVEPAAAPSPERARTSP